MINLAQQIINDKLTKVTLERFETIIRHQDAIKLLDGDIIECGVWKGGMGIFLRKMFAVKRLWLADSFSGFQDPNKAKYNFSNERHRLGGMTVPYEDVINAFKANGVEPDNIDFLVGYVNDTLPMANIQQLSLLRIDVDAYSATMEVLEHLYDKVVPNGYIIFDDTCLIETRHAINDFFTARGIDIKLRHPVTDEIIKFGLSDMPCGCYMIKE
jgi:O-methyltransferase